MKIRRSADAEDEILVEHYLKIWFSYGTPEEHFLGNAREITRTFISDSRDRLSFQAFLAVEEKEILGSVWAQERQSPYPEVIAEPWRKIGYIGAMFVEPNARGRGIGKALLQVAIEYLQSLGCTKILLHSSDAGRPLYEKQGFELTSELGIEGVSTGWRAPISRPHA